MDNLGIANILRKIADLLELEEVKFKPEAYRKAAFTIESLSESLEKIYQEKGLKGLEELPGIGKSIAEKIEELIRTGQLGYYEDLKKKIPINVEELMSIPGLGPKKIKILYQKLKIKNLSNLKKAIEKHQLKGLAGFGEVSEKNLLKGVEFIETKPKRILLGHADSIVNQIILRLEAVRGVKKIEVAGSFRRGKETIGDLDILAISSRPELIMQTFVSLPDAADVIAQGKTKSAIRLKNGLEVDLRVVKPEEYGSALMYFTGSKEHNVELRKICLSQGYTLNEYGLFSLKTKKRIAGKSEEEIYQRLGMDFIPPELRENSGEIESALKHQLPKLVAFKDVLSDLQVHSQWSDGANTVEEMAREAKRLGLKYLAITDHIGRVGIAHPLDEKRIKEQGKEIEEVSQKLNFPILRGGEIDILKDGNLATSQRVTKELEVVLLAVHSAFKMEKEKMTKRICRAFEICPKSIFSHPTGRLILEREPYQIDLDKIFESAKKNDVFLEINASPERLDLNSIYIKKAKEFGCKFSIGTDAHSKEQMHFLKLGIITARRGWLEKKDLLNCWDLEKVRKELKR